MTTNTMHMRIHIRINMHIDIHVFRHEQLRDLARAHLILTSDNPAVDDDVIFEEVRYQPVLTLIRCTCVYTCTYICIDMRRNM